MAKAVMVAEGMSTSEKAANINKIFLFHFFVSNKYIWSNVKFFELFK
jgi:hypothetical protein